MRERLQGPSPALAEASQWSVSSDECVERVVWRLNAICKAATMEFALSVGKLVISEFYAGDMNQWRTRDPQKDVSLRKLARHPQLPMNPIALYRSISMYELSERLGIASWQHISTSHMRLVLPLPPEEQARLLREAETNAWPVRRLDTEVGKAMKAMPDPKKTSRGGRKRHSRLTVALRSAVKCIDQVAELLGATDGELSDHSPQSARAAIILLQRVAQRCESLETSLAEALANTGAQSPSAACEDEVHSPSGTYPRSPEAADRPSETSLEIGDPCVLR